MTLFPGGFTNVPLPDADDVFLLDGRRKAVGAAVKTMAMPTRLTDATDYTTQAGSLINGAEATTNWAAAGLHSGSVTLSTAVFSQGAGSIYGLMDITAGVHCKLYYTPPGTQSITGRTLVAFDVWFATDGPVHDAPPEFEARVADGAALTAGNINSLSLAGAAYSAWTTVVLPLAGLSNITSIGVYRQVVTIGGATDRVYVRIDNVRFLPETKIDGALGAASSVNAWVPPNYTPDTNQQALFLPAGKGLIDPAKGVYSKQNNVVWLHDYLAHVVGAETGIVDVSFAVGRLINGATAGQTIRATPGATYRFDHDLVITKDDIIIDFTGAMCMLTYKSNTPFFTLSGSRNVVIQGGLWLGFGSLLANGSTLTNQAGTPATVSTTKTLQTLADEVKIPNHTNWLVSSNYARHLPQQLGLAADGLPPRAYFEWTLSDSAQVASDCTMSLIDDTTGTVLTTSTVTLTAVPTTYRISYEQTDLRQRIRATVKKATATTNTITVTNYTPYGEAEYNAAYDVASAFLIATSSYITLRDMWIEGFGGDAVQISDVSVSHVTVSRVVSRACRRQGMSFNQGSDFLIEDCVCAETGRSGIDFEPFSSSWETTRVTVRNITFYNINNYGIAAQNWARNFDYVIDGVDMYDTRLGVIFGGFTRGVFCNARNWSTTGLGMSADFDLMGISMEVFNIRSKVAVQCHTTTNTYDDGGGLLTYTPASNVVRSNTVNVVGGSGVLWVAGWRPDTLINIAVVAAATTHAVVFSGYTIPSGEFGVRVETNWNSGHPWITAKTNAGFTINFPNAAPGDSSGRITWSWYR